jgi:hypothetical protein
MSLYICLGTMQTPRPGGHPCHNAHRALTTADSGEVLTESARIVDWAKRNPTS